MDKITRIHIAKIPYEIGIDAEIELKKYIDAIRRELDDDLADEILTDIEVRITEILSARNINRNDVVSDVDIDAIEEQLGSPEQFTDSEAKGKPKNHQQYNEPKKLLRDPDDAYIGGVASGLGVYFGIDPLIVRLVFIALTFVSGLGILLYILLWILVPVAKTNSDKLRMRGVPVTAAALQRYRSTAERTIASLRIRTALRVIHKIIKAIFTVAVALLTLALLSSIGFASAILYTKPLHQPYVSYHLNYLLLGLLWLFSMTVIGLLIILLLKLWRHRSSSLKIAFVGLVSTLILTMAGIAIVSPFIVSHYKNLYGGNKLAVALPISNDTPLVNPTSLTVSADSDLVVSYVVSSEPLHATYKDYPGMIQPKIAMISKDGTLSVQATRLHQVVPSCVLNWCQGIYLPLRLTVYGPALQKFTATGSAELDISNVVQNNLTLVAENNANLSISNSDSENLNIVAQSGATIDASAATAQTSTITVQNGSYVVGPASNTVKLTLPENCDSTLLEFTQTPTNITLNNQPVSTPTISQNDCVNLDDSSPYGSFMFNEPRIPTPPKIPSTAVYVPGAKVHVHTKY
jgi:phage shock protein PspC (stress-responsive transcriptional regulator)